MASAAQRYVSFLEKHAALIALAFAVVTGLLGWSLSRLELHTDFEDLLPEGQPSVVALRQIMRRVGGMGALNVVLESPDSAASKRFALDLVAALRKQMGRELHSIDYTLTPIQRFYRKNGILYLSVEDLRELDSAFADATKRAKLKANPFYLDVEDEAPDEQPAQRVRAIEARARAKAARVNRFPEGYYLGEHGKLLAIFLRPNESSLEIHAARKIVNGVHEIVTALGPQRYHPGLRVSFTGSIKVTVEEHDAIVKDLAGTALLCIGLVGLVVWLYFRQGRALTLLALTLVGGAVWSFGIAAMISTALNAQTAFLGCIIVGTGINYGILLLARYFEERRRGASTSAALATCLGACFRPTFIAALATGASFGSLGIAHIRSFSQFGLIGGIGIVLCWALSYSVLPALLILMERVRWLELRAARPIVSRLAYPGWLARLPIARPGLVTAVFVLLSIGSLYGFVRFLPHALETDVNNLRDKASVRSGTRVIDQRVTQMMGETLSPAIVLATSSEQAQLICQAIDRVRAQYKTRPPVSWCRSLSSFLPDRQPEKLRIIARIRERLQRTPRDLLPDEVRRRLDELRGWLDVHALTIRDLPEELRQRFRDRSGNEGVIALVGAGEGMVLYVIEDLLAFTDVLREIRLANGEVIRSSGDMVVFADILRSIKVDAPRTTMLAAAGVLLMLIVVLRRARAIARVSAALAAGLALMLGAVAALRLKFNFLNFVAVPTTLGIGVDYPVNIHQRHIQAGAGSMPMVLRRTGPAVFVASLTTIIGYAVLLTSSSLALVSFGKLAIIGEVTCLAAALLLLPALAALSERRAATQVHPDDRPREEAPASPAASPALPDSLFHGQSQEPEAQPRMGAD